MKTFINIISLFCLLGGSFAVYAYEPPECNGKIVAKNGNIVCQEEHWILPTPPEVEADCAILALSSADGMTLCPEKLGDALFRTHYLVTQEYEEGKYGVTIPTFSLEERGIHWTPNLMTIFLLGFYIFLLFSFLYERKSMKVFKSSLGRDFAFISIKAFLTFVVYSMIMILIVSMNDLLFILTVVLSAVLAVHNAKRHLDYRNETTQEKNLT